MIPIRDANPTAIRPVINWLLIAGALWVFFFQQPQTPPDSVAFVYEWAAIPCELTTLDPLDVGEYRTGDCNPAAEGGTDLFGDKSVLLGVLVSMFLHGGLGHLLGNMWMLWIFGNNVEEAFGTAGYLAFYITAGVAATVGYVVANPGSTVPLVGASGAIAGVMGAYLALFPHARVVSLVPLFFFAAFEIPAGIYLLLWFAGQFALVGDAGQIAWEAHVAGFVFGLSVALILRRRLLRRVVTTHRRAAARRFRRR